MKIELSPPPIQKMHYGISQLSVTLFLSYILKVTEAENLNIVQRIATLKIGAIISLRYVSGLISSYFCKEGKYAL